MAKPVAAQMFAAIPTRHHDDVVAQIFAFQHSQYHHASAAFTIIVLERGNVCQAGPGVMRRLGELLATFQLFEKGFGIRLVLARPARDSIPRPAIRNDVFKDFHPDVGNRAKPIKQDQNDLGALASPTKAPAAHPVSVQKEPQPIGPFDMLKLYLQG